MRRSVSVASDSEGISTLFRGAAFLSWVGLLLILFGTPSIAQAQESGPGLRSDRQPVQVAVDPTYQYYETESGQVLTELSTYLSAYVPITQQLSVRARAGYAQMEGDADELPQIRGPTDVAGQVTYARQIGGGSVVVSLGANAPTGKQELTGQELRTTRAISQNFYDFRVSSFSRGLSVSPQVTVAYPISDRFAVGIGGGYQYQAGFRPQAQLEADYVPGNGVGVNAGADYKVTPSSALGVDVSFRRYAADRIGGARQFEAGNRITGTLRYLIRSGFTTIRAVARYTNWEESRFRFQQPDPAQGQVLPPHGLALASYQTRLTEGIRLHVRAAGHWYGETVGEDRKIVGRGYVSPSFALGDVVSIEPHGTVSYGSYLGLGGGIRIVGEF